MNQVDLNNSNHNHNQKTGCNYVGTTGSDPFVSVCEPDVPDVEMPERMKYNPLFDGERIIEPVTAVKMVYEGMERFTLYAAEDLTKPLHELVFEASMLVKRLDRADDYFYLPPAMLKGRVIGFGRVNARYGDLQSVFVLDGPSDPYELKRNKILESVLKSTFDRIEPHGQFRSRPCTFCPAPALVLQPCRESYSPHMPFWQITAGGHTVYIRMDGAVFSSLTMSGVAD